MAELRTVFSADSRSLDRTLGTVDSRIKRTEGFVSRAGATMAGFLGANVVAAGITKGWDFLKGATKNASDLNETLNLNRVIFKQHADAVISWSKDSDQAFGLSQNAALQATGQFGDMFSQLGFAGGQSVKMSKGVVQLAADLGSFKNLETSDVLERISAGFRGEYDSLQLLIPNITAARVQTEALTMTGKDSVDALTAQEKAAATLAIIQKDGAAAQGDFARTSDGMANATKRATAEWENAKAMLGKELLPAAQSVVNFLATEGIPTLVDFGGFVKSDVVPPVKLVGGAVVDTVQAFEKLPGPVRDAIVTLGLAAVAVRGFRAAAASSIGQGLVGRGGMLDDIRLRAMLAGSALTSAQGPAAKLGVVSGATARGGLSLLKGGATGLLGLLGGPWGLALAGGITALSLFGGESEDAAAKQAALNEASTALLETLNKETGALTRLSFDEIKKGLEQLGSYDVADKLGLNLELVTRAASGSKGALKELDVQLAAMAAAYAPGGPADLANIQVGGKGTGDRYREVIALSKTLTGDVTTQNGVVADARDRWDQFNRASGDTVEGQRKVASATNDAAAALKADAQAAAAALAAHNRLADALLAVVDAQVGFRNSVRDAMAGAKGFTGSIFSQTKAADEQLLSLRAVAGGWNDMPAKVQKSQGAYRQHRAEFLRVADAMNVPIERATKMADNWLEKAGLMTRTKPKLDVDTGPAQAGIDRISAELRGIRDEQVVISVSRTQTFGPRTEFAGGGPVFGPGTGRSDSIDARLSNGEYVMPADKTARYRGMLDAMRAGIFPPGFAAGGPGGGGRADLTSARARHRAFEAAITRLERLVSSLSDARSGVSDARSNLASRADKLHQQQTVRDLQQQLRAKGPNRLKGLDRRAAMADLSDARKELGRMERSDDRLAAAERRLERAIAAKNKQARQVAKNYGSAAQEAARLEKAEERLSKARDAAHGLLERSGLFTTGATTADMALKNMGTDLQTGAAWTKLIDQLGKSGLSKQLIAQFKAEGPSTQSLALGQSILDSGKIKDFNRAQAALQDQATAYGRLATGQMVPKTMVNIEKYYSGGQSEDEIAERIWFKIKSRR